MMVGNLGGTKMYDLYEYGIQTEKSTHRIHVDTDNKFVMVYRTQDGINVMPEPISIKNDDDWESGEYRIIKPKWAKGKPTARGIRILWNLIDGCDISRIPDSLIENIPTSSTSKKGRCALEISISMLRNGEIPIRFDVVEINDHKDQISGLDLQADKLMLQVKFDKGSFKRGLFMHVSLRLSKL